MRYVTCLRHKAASHSSQHVPGQPPHLCCKAAPQGRQVPLHLCVEVGAACEGARVVLNGYQQDVVVIDGSLVNGQVALLPCSKQAGAVDGSLVNGQVALQPCSKQAGVDSTRSQVLTISRHALCTPSSFEET